MALKKEYELRGHQANAIETTLKRKGEEIDPDEYLKGRE